MLYPDDGVKAGATKTPASVEVMVRLIPLPSFATTTVAPGTTAPEASRTVPETEPSPAVACAYAPATKASAHSEIPSAFLICSSSDPKPLDLQNSKKRFQ